MRLLLYSIFAFRDSDFHWGIYKHDISDGQLYPPFDDGSAPAEIGYFLPLLCRPWPLHFNETRYENGIYLSIYNTRNDFFSPTNGSNVTT